LEAKQIELDEADHKIIHQVDSQAKMISRHTRDIDELRELMKKGQSSGASSLVMLPSPVLSKGSDDSGLIELIRKLEDQLRDKSDRSECKRDNDKLQDLIETLMARMKKAEEDIEKLKKEVANIDAAKIRQELMQLNQLVLNSATKVELQ